MTTQASPGLNTPSAYQPLPGIAPNQSTLAAMSSGALPANVQPSGPNLGVGNNLTNSLLSVMSAAGANGSSPATVKPGGSPNLGNPGSPPEQQLSYPESALSGLSNLKFTG